MQHQSFEQLSHCKRINIVGSSGSGKSTFAKQLAEILKLSYVEMDQLFWQPNWQESQDDEFFASVELALQQPGWVLDGNYHRTGPLKWRYAQAVVWLDLSFVRTVYRVTKRVFERSLTQQELWPNTGNRETLSKAFFTKQSIIYWAITSRAKINQRYQTMMTAPEHSKLLFVHLSSPKQVELCLDAVNQSMSKNYDN